MKFKKVLSLNGDRQRTTAIQFIILLGVVSLFGDITYEGARSITGPYLAVLGASAVMVSFVAGLGEFIGYALRLVAGYLADHTKAYWPLTLIGYSLLVSVPLLALTGQWQLAVFLIIVERAGKAIRAPARDAMLSHATKQVGRGLGFGIHEALDQIGAIIGPLIFSIVFLFKGDYRDGFTILWIPALLTIIILLIAKIKVPVPEKLEIAVLAEQKTKIKSNVPKVFWFYTLFIVLSVAGFTNFQLISYHFKVQSVVTENQIPLLYAIAMGVDALVALIIGKTYDKIGLISLITIPLFTLPIPFCVLSHSYYLAIVGVILWGIVMGIHETIMRAAIADLIPLEHRGFAYGIFNTVYGISWFFGCTLMGLFYHFSINYLILFVSVMEILSVPAFILVRKELLAKKDNK